jgi:hypothetical protein
LVCNSQARPVPQPGHTKPSGQPLLNRYPTQAASWKALLKLDQGAGKRGHTSLVGVFYVCSNPNPHFPLQLIEPPEAEG